MSLPEATRAPNDRTLDRPRTSPGDGDLRRLEGAQARYLHRRPAPPVTRIVVLGAGFGGLELTTRLSDEFGTDVDVVLIDKTEDFVFGFSKLDVMFGRTGSEQVRHPYRDFIKPGVQFVQSTIRLIDPSARRVDTDAGVFDGDVLVVVLGADLQPEATPGLLEGGYDFSHRSRSLRASRRARRLRRRPGRRRRDLDAVQVPARAE